MGFFYRRVAQRRLVSGPFRVLIVGLYPFSTSEFQGRGATFLFIQQVRYNQVGLCVVRVFRASSVFSKGYGNVSNRVARVNQVAVWSSSSSAYPSNVLHFRHFGYAILPTSCNSMATIVLHRGVCRPNVFRCNGVQALTNDDGRLTYGFFSYGVLVGGSALIQVYSLSNGYGVTVLIANGVRTGSSRIVGRVL